MLYSNIKKIRDAFICMVLLLAISCVNNDSNSDLNTQGNKPNSSNDEDSINVTINEVKDVESYDNYKADNNCAFNVDGDVFSYLIGKSYTQVGGGIKIEFDEQGAIISGLLYQWSSYTSLGGYKGKVKLTSIDPSNPDGSITLYVSCKEKSITDGQVVLFMD
jgi:hypothetical protein